MPFEQLNLLGNTNPNLNFSKGGLPGSRHFQIFDGAFLSALWEILWMAFLIVCQPTESYEYAIPLLQSKSHWMQRLWRVSRMSEIVIG